MKWFQLVKPKTLTIKSKNLASADLTGLSCCFHKQLS